jgi:hypothetical protein
MEIVKERLPWEEAKTDWDQLMKSKCEWSFIGKQLPEKALVK